MHRIAADYLSQLTLVHDEVKKSLKGLPAEALDWSPGDGMNTLGVLVAHIAFAEKKWIGETVGGTPTKERRSEAFGQAGLSVPEARSLLDEALSQARAVLAGLAQEDWDRDFWHRPNGEAFTVMAPLGIALQHGATHLGHIQMTRQLWEQREAE